MSDLIKKSEPFGSLFFVLGVSFKVAPAIASSCDHPKILK